MRKSFSKFDSEIFMAIESQRNFCDSESLNPNLFVKLPRFLKEPVEERLRRKGHFISTEFLETHNLGILG